MDKKDLSKAEIEDLRNIIEAKSFLDKLFYEEPGTIHQLICLRCGHKWYPKIPNTVPGVCPSCKNRLWNRPKWKNSGPPRVRGAIVTGPARLLNPSIQDVQWWRRLSPEDKEALQAQLDQDALEFAREVQQALQGHMKLVKKRSKHEK